MIPLPLPRTTRHHLAWLLVCALLLAQTLGLAHRVLHAPSGSTQAMVHEAAHQDGLLEHLFGHHPGAPDCPLFDHLASADSLPSVATPAVAPAAPALRCAVPAVPAARASEPLFLARAPPARA